MHTLLVEELIGSDRVKGRLSCRAGQPAVEREGSIARIPDALQRIDEALAPGEVDRNEARHGQKATVAAVNRWLLGARPRTLPAAVVPVAIGAGAAVGGHSPVWWRVVPALVVSLALQIGVNYANDYSDGVRGTDDVRVGPARLVAGGLAKPSHVKRRHLPRSESQGWPASCWPSATTWWLIVVGLLAMLAGWGYTGGPKPYGYLGPRRALRFRLLWPCRHARHDLVQ